MQPREISPGQKLALRTKPAVVRVVAGHYVFNPCLNRVRFFGGHGSGFFIDPSGYVATNAHVVAAVHASESEVLAGLANLALKDCVAARQAELAKLAASKLEAFRRDVSQGLRVVKRVSVIVLPNGDKLTFDIKAFGAPAGSDSSKDVAILKVQTKHAPVLLLGDEERVQIQDQVFAFGYPGAADILQREGFLDEKSELEVTVTDGSVSARKTGPDGVPILQVTTLISPGNSGGPAVNAQGSVIGLATFGYQGYNFLVPASVIKEFVRQAGASNLPSPTDEVYASALELHWQRHYTEAIAKLEEVRQWYPAHPEVERLILDAREQQRAGREASAESSFAGRSAAILSIVVGLMLLGGVALRSGRKRQRWRAAARPNAGALGDEQSLAIAAVETSAPPSAAGSARPARSDSPLGATVAVSSFDGERLALLSAVGGVLNGQQFPVGPHGLLVGRDPNLSQVTISDVRVSSKHVWIGFQDGKLLAIDQGSRNGTYLRDMSQGRVTHTQLQHGDTLIIAEPEVCSLHVFIPPRT